LTRYWKVKPGEGIEEVHETLGSWRLYEDGPEGISDLAVAGCAAEGGQNDLSGFQSPAETETDSYVYHP
jgi:hypothetical protein